MTPNEPGSLLERVQFLNGVNMTILATETRWEVQRKAVLSFATGLIVLAASLSPCEARTIWTMQHATCGGESNCQFLDVVESRALAGAGKLAWRDGMVLNLKLLDGRTIQLADVPEEKRQTKSDMDIVQYRLIEHMAPLNYFLLWVTPAWTEGTPWGRYPLFEAFRFFLMPRLARTACACVPPQ